jgi:TRAP-type mannitol/chloroaromatic compound transport system substrate-binding protein
MTTGYAYDEVAPRFIERVNRASAGRLEIELFPAGALIPTFEGLDAVGKGAVEMAFSGGVYWRGVMPAADIFWAHPLTLGDNPAEFNYMWWELGMVEAAREEYAKHNDFFIAPLWSTNYGGTYSVKPIRTVHDFKGVKIRSFGATGDLWKAFGASIVSIPAGEMYTALATGTVDAAHWAGPHEFTALKIHEVAKYYLLPPVIGLIANDIFVHMDAWNALAPDIQEIVIGAARATSDEAAGLIRVLNARDVERMKQEGVTFSTLSDSDLEAMRAKALELLDETAKKDAGAAKAADILKEAMGLFGYR